VATYIDCLNENKWKKHPNSLLTTYTLSHIINFATRIYTVSCTEIDNIFVDNVRLSSSGMNLAGGWISIRSPCMQ
jgi:hypothetical protein